MRVKRKDTDRKSFLWILNWYSLSHHSMIHSHSLSLSHPCTPSPNRQLSSPSISEVHSSILFYTVWSQVPNKYIYISSILFTNKFYPRFKEKMIIHQNLSSKPLFFLFLCFEFNFFSKWKIKDAILFSEQKLKSTEKQGTVHSSNGIHIPNPEREFIGRKEKLLILSPLSFSFLSHPSTFFPSINC